MSIGQLTKLQILGVHNNQLASLYLFSKGSVKRSLSG